jgi:DNA-binding NtrC family response regulator
MTRILLIDDDAAIRETFTAILELEHYEVGASADLAGGLRRLSEEPFDLVLTDLFRHVFTPAALTDLEAITQLAPAVPIVVATAHAQAADLEPTCYGVAAILVKPIAIEILVTCLQGALAESRARIHSAQQTSAAGWEHLRSAHDHIAESSALPRHLAPPTE